VKKTKRQREIDRGGCPDLPAVEELAILRQELPHRLAGARA
jgi:hypothetical protein